MGSGPAEGCPQAGGGVCKDFQGSPQPSTTPTLGNSELRPAKGPVSAFHLVPRLGNWPVEKGSEARSRSGPKAKQKEGHHGTSFPDAGGAAIPPPPSPALRRSQGLEKGVSRTNSCLLSVTVLDIFCVQALLQEWGPGGQNTEIPAPVRRGSANHARRKPSVQ